MNIETEDASVMIARQITSCEESSSTSTSGSTSTTSTGTTSGNIGSGEQQTPPITGASNAYISGNQFYFILIVLTLNLK